MKRIFILLLALMPFSVLGQNSSYKNNGNGFEKNLNDRTSDELERHLQTTLINDIKHDKPFLKLDLGKSYGLSLMLKNDKTFNIIDDDKLDEMLLKFRPSKNFKWQFGEPIRAKSLFEN